MENVASKSDIVLNAHAGRRNHLKILHVIGALASGALLVTENKQGIKAVFPDSIYVGAKYSRLTAAVLGALSDPVTMSTINNAALNWYRDEYMPACNAQWKSVIKKIFYILI